MFVQMSAMSASHGTFSSNPALAPAVKRPAPIFLSLGHGEQTRIQWTFLATINKFPANDDGISRPRNRSGASTLRINDRIFFVL
jgi:hypothetical protein